MSGQVIAVVIIVLLVIVWLVCKSPIEGYGFNDKKADIIGLLEGYKEFNNKKADIIGLLEGFAKSNDRGNVRSERFADRFNEPAGYFATGGGDFLDDVADDDSKRIFGGKGGSNDFTGGCGCALGVTGMKTPYIANNASVLDYKKFGAEPNVMNNAVGSDRAYLSMTDYMPEGTNLFFDGDLYVPQYSYYSPPIY